MSVNITKNNENKLLDRKEIEAEISFDGPTPKRGDLKQAVSGKIGANPELMVIRKSMSNFGKKTIKVVLHIYKAKEMLMKTEPVYIKVREGLMEKPAKKKKEAKKAPAKK
ncbi:MAG: hypothetical protein ACP5N9_05855 [Candidatus Bilamarchaeum sp.]|jgi:small subunit ribosomal protein S24e